MIGTTMFSYLFVRFLKVTGQFFIGVTLISYMIDFTEFARSAGDAANYSFSTALALSALKMPFIIQLVVPFIIMFAAMTALVALNRKYELVVARSAGLSAWQFLAPIGVASLLVGLFTITVFNPLASASFSYAKELEAHIRGNESATPSRSIPWLSQRTDDGLAIIGAKSALDRGKDLRGVTLMRFDDTDHLIERIEADRAVLRTGYWHLFNAHIIKDEGGRKREAQMRIGTNLKPEFVTERLADPDTISLFELPHMIAVARSLGLQANAFATKMHSLFALPFLLVAMSLIAATVSMRFVRMGQSVTVILGGILAGFLLYVVSVMVTALGSAGIMPPILAAWLPTIAASLFGVTFLLFKEDG
ncbi:MAG: LPS export ABC transporter permease LptG [Rhizobiaceae bacterium]|nr:LPS export ABC transporter permease LptG [Rhizobiaceae bacterium]